jgi:hypothetical protein
MKNPGMYIRHPKARGEWAELRFMTRATELGFIVAKPWGDSAPFDLALVYRSLSRLCRDASQQPFEAPAPKERKNAADGASRGKQTHNPAQAPEGRKKRPSSQTSAVREQTRTPRHLGESRVPRFSRPVREA